MVKKVTLRELPPPAAPRKPRTTRAKKPRRTARKEPPRPATLGAGIRAARQGVAMGQIEAARLAGTTQSHLCLLENDQVDPKYSTLVKLAAVFQCAVHDLLPN